ncbi:MAG: hypothetical protein Q7J57_02745 [Gemmobacter sp.]|nr:hypothetical protein [Gemmobacter sp.]
MVLCLEVEAPYGSGTSTRWAQGQTQRIFGAYFTLVGAYALNNKDHARVDIGVNIRSPRASAGFELFLDTFLILRAAIRTYEGWYPAPDEPVHRAYLAAPQLHLFYLKSLNPDVPFFAICRAVSPVSDPDAAGWCFGFLCFPKPFPASSDLQASEAPRNYQTHGRYGSRGLYRRRSESDYGADPRQHYRCISVDPKSRSL